jgi:acyl-coenzyme A synthetase/AMP-(fatty) acid ligase
MHVVDMIFFWAKARPHHPAIIQSDTVITYKGLADAIRSVSERIMQFNLEPQEPVAVSIENPAYQLLVTFALLRSGFVVAPVFRKLLPFLRPSGIKNVIYTRGGLVQAGGRNIRFETSWLANANTPSVDIACNHQRTTHYPNLIFFSRSATTGTPTKNVYTSAALMEHLSTTAIRQNDEISRLLIMPGVAFSFGFNCACEQFYGGKTACFSPLEFSLVLISTYRIDGIFASPQILRGLGTLFSGHGSNGYHLDSLKSVRVGSQAGRDLVSKNFVLFAKAFFCPKITIVFGSTEAGVLTSTDSNTIIRTPGAVGHVLPWVELEIVDEGGNVLPTGQEGRIRCRTPFFLKNLAANRPEMPNGESKVWWYSDILGSMTIDGLLCVADRANVTGRADDVINQGDRTVSAGAP